MRYTWVLATACLCAAEDGLRGWLRYERLPPDLLEQAAVPSRIVALNETEGSPVYTAGLEVQEGLAGILGADVEITRAKHFDPGDAYQSGLGPEVIVGTQDAFPKSYVSDLGLETSTLKEDGFFLYRDEGRSGAVVVVGQNERGALYGAFEYLSILAQGMEGSKELRSVANNPSAPIRWVNQWDNMDGTIERGYAGLSIFFANGTVREDLSRVAPYARLLASVRVNAIIVNNVNADAKLLSDENMAGLTRIADLMRPWGVQIGISLNFASPMDYGGLSTFDPLDQGVIQWWTDVTVSLYAHVPDLVGYLVKASSEGQPGPLTYNRTLAEGANMFARAAAPHGGIIMFRAFVYDHHLSYLDWYNDRANAQVEFFGELDGQFDDNVVVQIKYGPIDFQVREPVSPLFAHLRHTATVMELQVAQEYLGQQCHLVYLPPLWREILDFDLRVDGERSLVGGDILTGERFGQRLSGYAAVVNVGLNATWLGSHLAMSNLYAYGATAWDPSADPEDTLEAWSRLTFGAGAGVSDVRDTVRAMSMASWPAYENYTGNLGVQTLTDITGPHYGPNPASQDHNGWGQWTRADGEGIGMDRTARNGTANAAQYPAEVAAVYEDVDATPEDLLLWFHHVPWTRELRGKGRTVIQWFYDAHFAGAETVAAFPGMWEGVRDAVDAERWGDVMFRLEYQAGHAIVWRDAVTQFYRNMSGIEDERGRVGLLLPGGRDEDGSSDNDYDVSDEGDDGETPAFFPASRRNPHHPFRLEAEAFPVLENYHVTAVNPFEAASGLRILQSDDNATACAAEARIPAWVLKSDFLDGVNGGHGGNGNNNNSSSTGEEAIVDVVVAYYDLYEGEASWTLRILDGSGNDGEEEEGSERSRTTTRTWSWTGDLERRLGYTLTRGIDGHSATRARFGGVAVRAGDVLRVEAVPRGRETAPLDYVALLPAGVVD